MPALPIEFVTRMVPLPDLIPNLGQVARHSQEKIRSLAENMAAHGQFHPIGINEDKRIMFGHGRYAAALLLGWQEIEAKVYQGILTETQFQVFGLVENIHREDLTAWEKYQQVVELQRLNPSLRNSELARMLNVADSWITQILSVSKALPAVQDAFKAGALGITEVYEIARRPGREQHDLLAAKLSGASRETLRSKARRSRNGEKQEARVSRIKIELPAITVVFAGKDISLDDAILAAPEAVKFMKKCQENGYTAKTISRMSAEKAAAAN